VQVTKNRKIVGPDGPREIDVLLESTIGPFRTCIAVECRDYRRKLNVQDVDGFESKMRDIKATQGIMVTRLGYSRTALQKARRVGIGLYTLNDSPESFRNAGAEIAISVSELSAKNVSFFCWPIRGLPLVPWPGWISNRVYVDQIDVAETVVRDILERSSAGNVATRTATVWEPPARTQHTIVSSSNESFVADRVKVTYWPELTHYFGYLSDSPSTTALIEADKEAADIHYRQSELFDYRARFAQHDDLEHLPFDPMLKLHSVAKSDEVFFVGDVGGDMKRVVVKDCT
jgi:Restriction endonuclease